MTLGGLVIEPSSVKGRVVSSTENVEAKNRLVGIRIAMLTLRLRDNWIRLFGDHETALIALAVIVVGSERLTRSTLQHGLESLALPLPPEDLAPCNVSSIAIATGLNRETTRRKIDQLARSGLIVRERSVIRLAPGFTQQDAAAETVQAQLNELKRTINDLLRIDAVSLEANTHPNG